MENTSTQKTEVASEPVRALMEVSVASVIFAFHGNVLCILAVRPSVHAAWTLPRHTFQSGMGLGDAAKLAVKHIANIPLYELFQVGTISAHESTSPIIEVGFLGATWVATENVSLTEEASKMGLEAKWLPLTEVQKLVPTAAALVESAATELRRKARFDRIIFSLLPPEFSLSELQKAFEIVIGRNIDVRNFRKKMESMKILEESDHKPRGMAHRPPRLFSFSPALYGKLLAEDPEARFF
jgi:hypothetical protein